MKRCPICGAKIEDGLETCPYCGEIVGSGRDKSAWAELAGSKERESRPAQVTTDPNKQTYYVEKDSVPQPTPTKKKSKAGIISAILIVIFIAAVGLYFAKGGINSGEPVVVDDVYNQTIEFFNTVYDDAVVLEDTGIEVADAWYNALESDADETAVNKAIKDAFALYQDDLDAVAENQANISYLYSKAVSMADQAGLYEMADAVETMYNEYFDFYEEVMNTDRSYDEYAQAFNDADDALYYSMQDLYDMLAE